jgi:O-antigen/teichoic acid export membrane protein
MRPAGGRRELDVEPHRMSRTKRFIGGVWLTYCSQALTVAVGLWLTPFLLRHLGQSNYGQWLIGLQLLTYLSLLDFGVTAVVPREVAYKVGAGESELAIGAVAGQSLRIAAGQTLLVVVALACLWRWTPPGWADLRGPVLLAGAIFALLFPFRVFRAVLEGVQELALLGRAQILSWAVGTTVMVVLVYGGLGLYALAMGWGVTQCVSTGVSYCYLRGRHRDALPHRGPFRRTEVVRWLGKGFWISLSQITQLLLAGTDILVIGKLLGAGAVVPYSCTAKLLSVLANQPQALMHAALPGLCEMRTSQPRERSAEVSTALNQAVLFLGGIVICVVLAINKPFTSWWVGPQQFGGTTLTVALAANMLLRHWNATLGYALFSHGYEKRLAVVGICDGLVVLGLSILLVSGMGMVGAMVASILGVCVVSLPVNVSTLAREQGVSPVEVIRPLWPWFWRLLVLSAAVWAVARALVPDTFWGIAAGSGAAAAIYLAVMLPATLRSAVGPYIRSLPQLADIPRASVMWRRVNLDV